MDKTPTQTFETRAVTHYEIENSLTIYDVWAILIRRRFALLAVGLVTFLSGVIYAYGAPITFLYTTTIDPGSYLSVNEDGATRVLVETPENIKQRLNMVVVPTVRSQTSVPSGRPPEVAVLTEENINLVTIQTVEEESEAGVVTDMHQRIAQQIIDTHAVPLNLEKQRLELQRDQALSRLSYTENETTERALIEPLEETIAEERRLVETIETSYQSSRTQLENERTSLNLSLEDLDDERRHLVRQSALITDERALIERQMEQGERQLEELFNTRNKANNEATDSAQAMSLLMMSTQIAQMRSRLDDLSRRLTIELPSREDEINQALQENVRAQIRIRNDLSALEKTIQKNDKDHLFEVEGQKASIQAAETDLSNGTLSYRQSIDAEKFEVRDKTNALSAIIPTTVTSVALRSVEPYSVGRYLIIALSIPMALVIAIFAAFGLEFVQRANLHLQQDQPPGKHE